MKMHHSFFSFFSCFPIERWPVVIQTAKLKAGSVECCKDKCVQDIPIREVKEAREQYSKENGQERKGILTGAIKNGLAFNRVFLCSKAWCMVHRISQIRYISFQIT